MTTGDLWTAGQNPGEGRADIIIPVYNQVQYTKGCLQSLRECTTYPYRVIVIDNASTDETAELLQTYAAEGLPLEIITNAENLGFTRAANQGLQAATGRYAVFLNNDTLLTQGWLTGLTMTAESDDRIGIVGPKILSPQTHCIHCIGGLVFYKCTASRKLDQEIC